MAHLRKELYPAFKELAAFWDDYMTWDAVASRYVVEHSGSHEGWDDFNSGLDLGYIRTVHRTLIETSRVLGVDRAERARWQHILDTGSSLPTSTYAGTSVYTLAETIDPAHADFVVGDQPINLEGVVHPAESIQRPGNVDLTARGGIDWVHWGRTAVGEADRKAVASPSIGELATIGLGDPARRLRIHLGAWSAEGELTATLSDGSAPVWRGTFDAASGSAYGTAELRFAAASPQATLTITYQVGTSHSAAGDGNVTLHAATLDR
ncbi:hypothetical protein [Streptomyces sp. NBC_00209]|uniref:hypothetical protein n=1 Tax=Streptomyces sp. NBC_00209 TaxID=2975682 RepID=UPI003254B130